MSSADIARSSQGVDGEKKRYLYSVNGVLMVLTLSLLHDVLAANDKQRAERNYPKMTLSEVKHQR